MSTQPENTRSEDVRSESTREESAADAAQDAGSDLLAQATDADDDAARAEPRDVEGDIA